MNELIMGVHIGHDSSITLLDRRTGRILFAEEEERPRKEKNYFGMPELVIENALNHVGATVEDIQTVALGWNLEKLDKSRNSFYREAMEKGDMRWGMKKLENMIQIQNYAGQLSQIFPKAEILEVDHHLAHALSVFPFQRIDDVNMVPAIIMDAVGEFISTTLYQNLDKKGNILLEWPVQASVGYFYQRWAEVLGFKGRQACGYFMSLAAHGNKKRYRKMISEHCVGKSPEGLDWISPDTFNPMAGYGSTAKHCFPETLIESLGLCCPPSEPIKKADVAAAVQAITEEIVLGLVRWLRERVQGQELILSGGVFLNCAVNQGILQSEIFEKIHLGPVAKDSGVSTGAAIYAWMNSMDSIPDSIPQASVFLGTRIMGEEDAWKELSDTYPDVTTPDDIQKALAQDLLGGSLVAIAEGPLEFGPRALGGRSILADPANRKMIPLLNQIKNRYSFQPIAATMSITAAREFFDLITPEPYMTTLYKSTSQAARKIPAALHVDGTCRLHTMEGEKSHLLYRVLQEIETQGRPAVLLNTSFNRKGHPLPATALDAIKEYCSMLIDVLYTSKMRIKLSWEEKESYLKRLKTKGERSDE
jgi:carbamoyltransferase